MTWQEYQEAVARLYEQAEGIGEVKRDVRIPDKVTGQTRQIDTLIELDAKGHTVQILIDAKFHSDKIDIKEVEGVLALAAAVNACKAIIVCSNGWTEPAKARAVHSNMGLRLLDIDQALDLIVPDKWSLCPSCERLHCLQHHRIERLERASVACGRWAVPRVPPLHGLVLGLRDGSLA